MLSEADRRLRGCGYETCIIYFGGFCYFRPRSYDKHCPVNKRQIEQEATMFPIIRAHRDARILSRQLRKSLASPDDNWKIETDEEGHPTLSNSGFLIALVPRASRLFDAVHVYNNDAEIWLPLLARLRLRAAARWRLIHDASEHLQASDLKKTRARRRA